MAPLTLQKSLPTLPSQEPSHALASNILNFNSYPLAIHFFKQHYLHLANIGLKPSCLTTPKFNIFFITNLFNTDCPTPRESPEHFQLFHTRIAPSILPPSRLLA